MAEHLDVLVVGAGISGIGAGYYLQERCPDRSFAILEGRPCIGGTWDLFRYPGIRSDSDMYTLGYAFRPWREQKAIADGPSILKYLNETVDEYDLRKRIRFHHKVKGASWSTADARWSVSIERADTGEQFELTCNFLFMCSGYYDYRGGHAPEFAGRDSFEGTIVHPQKWPEDLDYTGKRVVVIGSGATAVTLVPAMAETAEHVTMLQRSPTYILSAPAEDPVANWLRDKLPAKAAYSIVRWKNVLFQMLFFNMSRWRPEKMREWLRKPQVEALGEDTVESHFTPSYNPWDQRLCLIPDGDLYESISAGKASVVTDHIESFTPGGIMLRSGEELPADIIVTATGLKLLFLAGIEVRVDGRLVDPADTMSYKAMMFSDVPNLALSFGYTNASWTLKSDLTGEYVCRLLNHMSRHGYKRCVPRQNDPSVKEIPFLDFSSGYVTRALKYLPKQGSKAPWRLYQNYLMDILSIRHGKLEHPAMEFS